MRHRTTIGNTRWTHQSTDSFNAKYAAQYGGNKQTTSYVCTFYADGYRHAPVSYCKTSPESGPFPRDALLPQSPSAASVSVAYLTLPWLLTNFAIGCLAKSDQIKKAGPRSVEHSSYVEEFRANENSARKMVFFCTTWACISPGPNFPFSVGD